jgi:hypothetical protein
MRSIVYWIIGFVLLTTITGKSYAASVVGSPKFSTYSTNRQTEINGLLALYPPPAQNDSPKQFDIYMVAGTDYELFLKIVDSMGIADDITGYQYAAQYRSTPLGTLFATYSTAIVDAPTGKLKVTLSSAQTTALSGTSGVWDLLQVAYSSGKRSYLMSGKVTDSAPVTP